MQSDSPQASTVFKTAKLIVPAIFTGAAKAGLGFSLISVPTFISYFGSNSHKLEKGQEGIITSLSKSLFSMNLVSNIGQELSPILCGEYAEYCKIGSRVSGMAVQTYTFNQTPASGIAKGISYEIFGFNYKSFLISEAVGTSSEPVFAKIYDNYLNNIRETNVTEVLNTISNNLQRDEIVTHHIYSAASCLYKPIVMGEDLNPYAMFLYGYLLSDLSPAAVYETAINIYENAKDYFVGENSQHDEF